MDNQAPQQGPPSRRDPRYQQQIIKFAGTLIYLRVDTGPDLESVLICFDDDEPDTHDIGKTYGIKTAHTFIELMRHAGHAPSEELR